MDKKWFKKIIGLIGLGMGYGFVEIGGGFTIVIIVVTVMLGFLFNKIFREKLKPLAPAFGVQVAHLAWILIGVIATLSTLSNMPFILGISLFIGPVVYILLLVWMFIKPGKASIITLTVYQGLFCLDNFYQLIIFEEHTYLILHMCLRILAIVFMIIGLSKINKPLVNEMVEQPINN